MLVVLEILLVVKPFAAVEVLRTEVLEELVVDAAATRTAATAIGVANA